MKQDQLDGLVTFVCVAESRGFSAAAVRLGVSPSAVSQTVRQLETRMGAPLFSRTTRSVALTEAGARFLERVRPAVQELTFASEELAGSASRPVGLLRLNVPRVAYLFVLRPMLGRFLQTYPELNLEIAIDSSMADVVGLGFDAGIRFGAQVARDMVGIPIGPQLRNCLVAAPAYLERRGTPAHPRDLTAHECIGYRFASSGQLERWELEHDGELLSLATSGRLVFNDVSALLNAAIDGLGIANLVDCYAAPALADGRLLGLFPDWCPYLPQLMLYYPSRKRMPTKLRALIDFLHEAR